ncbi:hypothetical protein DXG03_007283 [Asterophora parasitica]|uniref:Uncharacterized protein n=1 Tax=Asterophora parasitica TaxID=117018 RepID=A0A9P7G872_9AGAR|nr:hypothetical protein DXG03_007283 [Asterophora parasitica]
MFLYAPPAAASFAAPRFSTIPAMLSDIKRLQEAMDLWIALISTRNETCQRWSAAQYIPVSSAPSSSSGDTFPAAMSGDFLASSLAVVAIVAHVLSGLPSYFISPAWQEFPTTTPACRSATRSIASPSSPTTTLIGSPSLTLFSPGRKADIVDTASPSSDPPGSLQENGIDTNIAKMPKGNEDGPSLPEEGSSEPPDEDPPPDPPSHP